jgi:XRE family transcriptional regulator, regulator of sulfur utilization
MPTTSRNPVRALAFGETVRTLREDSGVAQEALALEAGMYRSYLGKLERGEKQPSLDLVFRLAVVLSVTPAELVE